MSEENDLVARLKGSIEIIEDNGHSVVPLSGGNYYIRWASCKCVEVDALKLIELAEEIEDAH